MNYRISARLATIVIVLILATLDTQSTIAQDTDTADFLSPPPPAAEPAGSIELPTREPTTDTLNDAYPVTDNAKPDLASDVPIPELPSKLVDTATEQREQEMLQLFESGDFIFAETEELPAEIVIRRRVVEQFTEVNDVNGVAIPETKNVVRYQQETVQPKDSNLNAEQRLGVMVAILEEKLRSANEDLVKVEDDEQKKELLNGLHELYSERFAIDTAYQDYKVRKIEQRAAKLRAEVNARKSAGDEWVEAMVTLAKMRASGIETMPAITPSYPNVNQHPPLNRSSNTNALSTPALLPRPPNNNAFQTPSQTFSEVLQPDNVLSPPHFAPR